MLWYRYGSDPLPIGWVLTSDPEGKRPRHPPCFQPIKVRLPRKLSRMRMKRWSLETTFEEVRAYVGIETQRQWSDLAIKCTTPALFGLYSLITLFGHALHPDGSIPVAQAVWYRKQVATLRSGVGGSSVAPVGQFLFSHISF